MTRVLLATRNAKKLDELRRIVSSVGISGLDVIGLDEVAAFPEAPEVGATFADNALDKARDAAEATGIPAVADDSGLAVDALHGMPGVLSARWAGQHGDDTANLQLLLGQMSDVPDDRRGAAFVCAAALVLPSRSEPTEISSEIPSEIVVHGEWPGWVTREPRGANGFGYDPIFVPENETRTSAELDQSEKDAVSHRGRALRALTPYLREISRS